VVDISNDDGVTWTNAETVGPSGAGTSGGWVYHEFDVADFVTPTSEVRLRFIASDEGDGSLVEAALDDFLIFLFTCEDPETCPWDHNGDGVVNPLDVNRVKDNFGCDTADPECAAYDHNADNVVNPLDVNRVKDHYGPCP
jgi:hypothetical protein